MKELILVFLGGGMGSVSRYAISLYFLKFNTWQFNALAATLTANTLSTIMLGFIWLGISTGKLDPQLKFLLLVGYCGGFSTFSTFSFETFQLLRQGLFWVAALNVVVSVAVGLAILWLVFKVHVD